LDIKKINKKAQQSTLTGLVVVMLIAIGIFGGIFLFFQEVMLDNGANIPTKYDDTYGRLIESQQSIDDNVKSVQDSFNDIYEADNVWQVAWNGLKGLGSIIKLPVIFIANGIYIANNLITGIDSIPTFYKALALTGILAAMVFLILALLKGESRM
jgi:hypothetical protein